MRRLLIVACLVGAIVAICSALIARRHVDRARVAARVARVDIDSGIGDVVVLGSRRSDVVVTQTYHFLAGRPSLSRRVEHGVLRVSSRCPRLDFACTVRTRVEVPEGTPLKVRVTAGGVEVRRLHAEIDVHARDGGVSIRDSTGRVTARTGTGLVTLKRVRGAATVRTDLGDVALDDVQGSARVAAGEGDIRGRRLAGLELDGSADAGIVSVSYAEPPTRVRVHTRVGGVAVRVPSGAYAVYAIADQGRVRVTGLTRDPRALRVIDVRAGAGDVAVMGRQGGTGADRSRR